MSESAGQGDTVFCYSGDSYAQRPVGFLYFDEKIDVKKVLSEARVSDGKRFTILAGDGQVFDLRYDEGQDAWLVQPSSADLSAK